MGTVIVERDFDQPATEDQVEAMRRATEVCLELNGVTHLRTVGTQDGKRFICMFEAPDAESVRRALESAHVPFKSAWSAKTYYER